MVEGTLPQAHPAYLRWRDGGFGRDAPTSVITVRTHPGSSEVYRLEGVRPGRRPVIAKRARRGSIELEALIQGRLLEDMDLAAVRCFGSVVEEDGRYGWLFMDYVEGEEPLWSDEVRKAAARWLAKLHSRSSQMRLETSVPIIDERRYRSYLSSALERLSAGRGDPRLDLHVELLDRLLETCSEIERRWSDVRDRMDRLPSALMHGDFIPKNIRLGDRTGPDVLVLDWEAAGWGPPAEDISVVDLEAYGAAISGPWADHCSRVLDEMNALGTVFRLIAWIQGETAALSTQWLDDSISDLSDYELELRGAWKELAAV